MVDFTIRIVMDTRNVDNGVRRVRKELVETDKAAVGLGASLGKIFALAGGGFAAASAVRTLANFSQEISTVAAVSDATAQELQKLEERAISLGTNTRFSATQAAQAMSELARAGFQANAVFEVVDDTLNLAQAGALDLARAAEITGTTLTGFRLNVSEAGRVVDVLASAANSTNTSVTELAEALKFVAPVAAGMKVSIEETAAAVGVLSNAGLKASIAGTGLRQVLSELETPSTRTEKIFKELGIRLDEVQVSEVGLTPALQRLAKAGLTVGQAIKVFGDRGGPAAEVLNALIGDIEGLTQKFQEAEGTTERVARIMDDNLNGAILATKSAVEGLILRLGKAGLSDALREVFGFLTNGLRTAAGDIDAFIVKMEGLAFVLGVTFARFAVGRTISAINALGAALLTNPFGVMLTGVTLVTGALISLRDELTLTEESTTTVRDVAVAAFAQIESIIDSFVPLIKELAKSIDENLGSSFEGFELNLQNSLLFLGTFTDSALGILLGLGNSLVALFSGIGPAIGSAFFVITNGVINLIEGGTDRARAFFNSVGTTAKILGLGLATFFREIDLALTQLAQGQFAAAQETASQAQSLLTGQLAGVGSQFTSVFRAEMQQLSGERLLENLENPFANAGGDLAQAMTEGFNSGLDFSGTTDLILKSIDVANAQREQADQAERIAAAQSAANTVVEAGIPLVDKFAQGTQSAAQATDTLGTNLNDGLRAGLEAGLRGITDVAGAAETAMVNAFGSAEDAIVEFATTGKVNFSAFVDGLLADVARILARQALLGLINAFTGGGVGAAGLAAGAFGGTRAEGGPVNPNQAFLVGEQGPELFVPPGAGNIMTAAETSAAANGGTRDIQVQSPPVNVSVVNVTDPSEIISALNSAQGEQVVLNIISRNRSNVKNSIA